MHFSQGFNIPSYYAMIGRGPKPTASACAHIGIDSNSNKVPVYFCCKHPGNGHATDYDCTLPM